MCTVNVTWVRITVTQQKAPVANHKQKPNHDALASYEPIVASSGVGQKLRELLGKLLGKLGKLLGKLSKRNSENTR